jgi:hypothetical protein
MNIEQYKSKHVCVFMSNISLTIVYFIGFNHILTLQK